jgi:predicted CXXCH cytochrome family protein
MMGSLGTRWFPAVVFVVLCGAAIGGCADEKSVYDSQIEFTDPPLAARGFLGYDEADVKLTICGNCQGSVQGQWELTAHAGAWASLQASGHATESCEDCHTVGPLGNATSGAVGHAASPEERYLDVQCESCHGPGLTHVAGPSAVKPLASIQAATNLSDGCGECHQGTHHPFVEEWEQSAHARSSLHIRSAAASNPTLFGFCLDCHSAQGALEAWGVRGAYKEADDPVDAYLGIVCAVCHDPHSTANEAQLRKTLTARSLDTNLCMVCHAGDATPEAVIAQRPPHSPAASVLLGEAGWWPEGAEPAAPVVMTHGTSANQKLCAACHVTAFPVTDAATGAFVFQATGHLFDAIPCVDAEGIPVPEEDCDVESRSFASCGVTGCHGTEAVGRALYTWIAGDIGLLVTQVETLLDQVPAGEEDDHDDRFTVAEGARFNLRLVAFPGTVIHNPRLARELLNASKDALVDGYGLTGGGS